jgi:hypothetical protein
MRLDADETAKADNHEEHEGKDPIENAERSDPPGAEYRVTGSGAR